MSNETCRDFIDEDLYFKQPRWGKIFVHNKRPANVESFASNKIVVLQHGATYGSAAGYVLAGGMSWMDYLVARGRYESSIGHYSIERLTSFYHCRPIGVENSVKSLVRMNDHHQLAGLQGLN